MRFITRGTVVSTDLRAVSEFSRNKGGTFTLFFGHGVPQKLYSRVMLHIAFGHVLLHAVLRTVG